MTNAEIWAREGGDLELRKSPRPDTYTFRITDKNAEVTIRFDIRTADLRDLRKWIKDVLK